MELLNKVQLIGRIGNDPCENLKYSTSNGDAMTYFSLAINRANAKNETVTDWFNIKAYGKVAEIIVKHGEKGQLVYIEGRLEPLEKGATAIILSGPFAQFRVVKSAKKAI
ncbi:single-stranded DNA-binding protein [Xenorhabdus sp. TH1]|uniref:single-stranded DNA-binding protein n=1 Tax=Xenorhabdus sp. TH1 TaxID=3130166 RepID=UPI0030CB2A74